MSKGISGLAKVEVREEVESCIEGLRSEHTFAIEASTQQLQHSLAEVVGSNLLPFVCRLGGEIVAVCKRTHVPSVWEASAALCLAAGGACCKPLCEPLLDHLVHTPETRDSASLTAAATFLAVSGRFMPAALRTSVDYLCVKHLYEALVLCTAPLTHVHEYLSLLTASLAVPSLLCNSPIRPHALVVARKASQHPKLEPDTRTAALVLLHFLDSQVHTLADPIAVPTFDELNAHLKRLVGGDAAGEMALFSTAQPTQGLFDAAAEVSHLAAPHLTGGFTAAPPAAASVPAPATEQQEAPAAAAAAAVPVASPAAAEAAAAPASKRVRLNGDGDGNGSSGAMAPVAFAVPKAAVFSAVSSGVQPLAAPAGAAAPVVLQPAEMAPAPAPVPVPVVDEAAAKAAEEEAAAAAAKAAAAEVSGMEVKGDIDDNDADDSSVGSIDMPDLDL